MKCVICKIPIKHMYIMFVNDVICLNCWHNLKKSTTGRRKDLIKMFKPNEYCKKCESIKSFNKLCDKCKIQLKDQLFGDDKQS